MVQKPDLSIFTGSESFGDVYTEQNQITLKYWEANLPFSTTAGRIATQILGKTRIIMIQGATDGTGFTGINNDAQINNFKDAMEGWLNANIQSSISYYDSLGNEYTVDGVDFMWVRSFNNPSQILYTLIMKEA